MEKIQNFQSVNVFFAYMFPTIRYPGKEGRAFFFFLNLQINVKILLPKEFSSCKRYTSP